jgi:hypothetical protein
MTSPFGLSKEQEWVCYPQIEANKIGQDPICASHFPKANCSNGDNEDFDSQYLGCYCSIHGMLAHPSNAQGFYV